MAPQKQKSSNFSSTGPRDLVVRERHAVLGGVGPTQRGRERLHVEWSGSNFMRRFCDCQGIKSLADKELVYGWMDGWKLVE